MMIHWHPHLFVAGVIVLAEALNKLEHTEPIRGPDCAQGRGLWCG